MSILPGNLSPADLQIVHRALGATVEGPFFPEREFDTLFGLHRSEVRAIYEEWPSPACRSDRLLAAMIGSLNNLLGYPHKHEDALCRYFPEGRIALSATLARLAALDG
ncbi:hypothetical protein BRADO1344 [Bradyrhizobium sp. ORS 278]|uniref:hypothetical protein n=1 Tax=Bradyrhizobium sp. (strain ORS 278) TaxID=114615 RepID=UPI00015075EF|nr:hypothetical protein [Bradyrhizobium sp. ORS 278]CAL75240.1 hypothetical protein BRADO1344 [Bradyrhizobium sp. ORS 278]